MKIANPLYDHAFKYLMSNEKYAKKVLSVILDKEVVGVELSQQEFVVTDTIRNFTLYRLDFKAQIKNENGKVETVLIELQKSKLPTNKLRFRNYLSQAYSEKKQLKSEETSLYPIIAIYILGYNLEDIPVMATRIDRKISDASTGEELMIESDFINLLTHQCVVLQVRRLPEKRKTKIENFMTLFNQGWIAEENFILDLEKVPEGFEDIATHLSLPLVEENIRKQLRAEQEVESLFAKQEASIKEANELAQKAKVMAEKAIKDRIEAEERVEKERQQKQEAKYKLAKTMLKYGEPLEEIIKETGLTVEEVQELM